MDKWSVFFILAVISSIISTLSIVQLKKRHPKKYEELGEPKAYWNGTTESTYYVSYVLSFKFLELKDKFIRLLFLADAFIFFITFTLFVILMYGVFFK